MKNSVELRLENKCDVMQKLIQLLIPLYNNSRENKDKKNLLETLIGAGIFYLGGGQAMYGGYISLKALNHLKKGKKLESLTKDHRNPRKQSGRKLLESDYKNFSQKSLLKLYVEVYGKFNYVTKEENNELKHITKKFSFNEKMNWKKLYKKAGIKVIKISLDKLKKI